MTLVRLWGAVCLWLVILSGAALGQGNDLEITITLIPSGAEREADLTSRIELPRAAATTAVARSAAGLAVANESREEAAARGEDGRARAAVARENGLAIAAEMRARRADVGAEIGAAAREARENFVRGAQDSGLELPIPAHLPELPTGRPTLPVDAGPGQGT